MIKTVCLVHGVGFFNVNSKRSNDVKSFADKLSKNTGANCIIYNWNHEGAPPEDDRDSFLFAPLKKWVHEIIMDFSYVVRYLDKLIDNMPKADLYVGHSAGGIIVALGTIGPQVVMGCPLQLVKNINSDARIKANRLYHLMHYRDPIAAPITDANNIILYDPLLLPFINPVSAHIGYWESSTVLNFISNCYKSIFN